MIYPPGTMNISMETDSPIIADSSGLFALIDHNDTTHNKAKKISETLLSASNVILISSEIFAETINTLWKKTSKAKSLLAAHYFLGTSGFIIIETPQEVRHHALKIFEELKSKMPSFTDCLVMSFANHFKTKLIFGFDECFKTSGYLRLGIDTKQTLL